VESGGLIGEILTNGSGLNLGRLIMPSTKKVIGIFFGIDNLVIAEIENKNLVSHCCIPYVLSSEEKKTSLDELDQIKLAAVLQNALKENAIETKSAIVSLPIKNIILRSFFMPAMPQEELDAAIEFEAKKYIPFRLDELNHDYQLFKIKEDKIRKVRILFVGVKNELLKKYRFALDQAGIQIKYIEPSSVSLLRALTFKKKIDQQQTAAVVEVNTKGGNIIISDNGIPTFINDFRFSSGASDEQEMQSDVLLARLANDIRLSIDYYRRHTPKASIASIVLCPEEIPQEVIEGLKKEIDTPLISIDAKEVLELKDSARISLLHAYGAGMRDSVPAGVTIDLYRKIAEAAIAKSPGVLKPRKLTSEQIKKLIQTGIIALTLVSVFFLFNLRRVLSLKSQLKKISKQQIAVKPDLSSLSKRELESKLLTLRKKLRIFSGIKKEKTVTPLLDALPQLIPEGVWLYSLNFNTDIENSLVFLDIAGACYTENRSIQINIINQFISNLKKNPVFSEKFDEIDINSMTQHEMDNWLITDFILSFR